MFLEIKDVVLCYDTAMVLNRVSLNLDLGELISLVGPNGAGKSSLIRVISGLVKWEKDQFKGTPRGRITIEGSVLFDGEEMLALAPHKIARRGLMICPERGRLFREMTVLQNLEAGGYLCESKKVLQRKKEQVYQLFPLLKTREDQIAGTLSGGERLMLAIARTLMTDARLLLVDEPSTGLAPMIKRNLFERVREIHGMGISILMTEQDVSFAFNLANRNYVISAGQIIGKGTSSELLADNLIRETYLGL